MPIHTLTCNYPALNLVPDGTSPTYVFTPTGCVIETVMVNGYAVQLTNNQNGTVSCIISPVHRNVTVQVNYTLR
jgi:hypothetical protein